MKFNAVYYEPNIFHYQLGKELKKSYQHLPWIQIDNHNRIEEMTSQPNSAFPRMKKNLIIGIRKTHRYTENHKISDFLVPYTSSGCSAMCLYCYLVCNYNKCAYLRLFVNREQMLEKIIRKAESSPTPLVFEIGSNSDLILENTITKNLEWTISQFRDSKNGFLTFPTKFDMVQPLLSLDHQGKILFRMSVNPDPIIRRIELGTSSLDRRIKAANDMCEAGYPTGILIAPIILLEDWKQSYGQLITQLSDQLSEKLKRQLKLEIIFMTYSNIHRFINRDAFPNALDLFDQDLMRGRGRGKYTYRDLARTEAEIFLREQVGKKLPDAEIVYIC